MRTITSLRLIDGPLVLVDQTEVVKRMGAQLMTDDAFRNRTDAMLSLRRAGFDTLEIVLNLDDARQVAVQTIVAREMAGS
jgi:uncharacterized membrane protein